MRGPFLCGRICERDYGDSECREFLVLGLRARRQKYREWDRGIRHECVSGLEFSGDGFVLGALCEFVY